MTLKCVSCEAGAPMKPFRGETFEIVRDGLKATVTGLAGHRCPSCGEVEFEPESAARYAGAGDALVLEIRRQRGEELRRIRKKLGLNQADAARLTGGGHNAFSRYESGKVTPAPAVINLFRLLDRHPEELAALTGA